MAAQNIFFIVFPQYLFSQEEFFHSDNDIRKVLKIPFRMTQSFGIIFVFTLKNGKKLPFKPFFRDFLSDKIFTSVDKSNLKIPPKMPEK